MNGLDSLYQDIILDAAKRRRGEGEITPFTAEHFEKNPSCGDEIRLRVHLEDGKIAQLGWRGDGCSISMASTSIMVEQLTGASIEIEQLGWRGDGCSISMASTSIMVEQLTGASIAQARDGIEALRGMLRARTATGLSIEQEELLGDAIAFEGVGKYVMRVKCAMLGWVALEAALREAEA